MENPVEVDKRLKAILEERRIKIDLSRFGDMPRVEKLLLLYGSFRSVITLDVLLSIFNIMIIFSGQSILNYILAGFTGYSLWRANTYRLARRDIKKLIQEFLSFER